MDSEGGRVTTEETGAFWAGDFGDEYHRRNTGSLINNMQFFRRALHMIDHHRQPLTVLELGAGAGNNLVAIDGLMAKHREEMPQILPPTFTAIEINASACACLRTGPVGRRTNVIQSNLLELTQDQYADMQSQLVLCKGVLIHIHPTHLREVYERIWRAARRYILIAEYYSPGHQEIEYRGNKGRLWKGDFAGELKNMYHMDLQLIDYGFTYHGDRYPQDDLTWFLLEKRL